MKNLLLFAVLLANCAAFSQVGIGNTNPQASLDISAKAVPDNTDGLLIPRIDDFPTPTPTANQDGMMVFLTGAGTPAKGFYYWDQDAGPAAWVAVTGGASDADFYEVGTTTSPDNITDDIFTQGRMALGKTTVGSTILDIDNNNRESAITLNGDSSFGTSYGLHSILDGSSIVAGVFNEMIGSSTGKFGLRSEFTGATAGGISVGANSRFESTGSANNFGVYNTFISSNSTGAIITGVRNWFHATGSYTGALTGVTNDLENNDDGLHIGVDNNIVGTGSGEKYGTRTIIPLSAGGLQYGIYSDVRNVTGYAGYFLGRTSFGTGTTNRYLMPAVDGASGQVMTTNGSGTLSFQDPAGDADWYEAGTTSSPTSNTAEIFTGGNVGIGISNPDNPLHIGIITPFDLSYDNSGQDGVYINGGGDNSGINAIGGSISFGPPSSTRADHRKSAIASVQTGGDVDFTGIGFYVHGNSINQSPMVEGMRLTHNRRLGINNPAPSATLDVIGTMQFEDGNEAAGFVLSSDASGNASWVDPNTLVTDDTDWTTVGSDIERQTGDVYVGDDATTDNDLYISDRLIDWDNTAFYVDPNATSAVDEINFSDGGASDPSIRFNGDTNTGLYQTEANAISFGASGTEYLKFSPKGQIEFLNTGNSVFVGSQAGNADDYSDNQNVGVGNFALLNNTTGNANVALGYLSLRTNITGASNVGVGYGTLFANNSGTFNVAMGRNALSSNLDGDHNIGIGNQTLFDNASGSHNIALGNQALFDVTSSSNIGIGRSAGSRITSGTRNIGIGYRAQAAHLTGNDNIVIGERAMDTSTSSSSNVVMGSSALTNMTSGNNNTVIGHSALGSNTGAAPNIANNNVAIGYQAGQTSEGDGNIYLGYRAGQLDGTASNHLYIENSNADEDNALIYGEFDNDILRTNGELQVGNPTGTGFAFPTTDGTVNQILETDGTGQLSWVSPAVSTPTASNGLSIGSGDVQLGGALTEDTAITYGNFDTRFNLTGTGDFIIQNNGSGMWELNDNGDEVIGGGSYWRQTNIAGAITATLLSTANDATLALRDSGTITTSLAGSGNSYFNGGNVGMGLTNPNYQLEVVNNTAGFVASFENEDTAVTADGVRIELAATNPNASGYYVGFFSGGLSAPNGRITGNGSGGVIYLTVSDARLKTNMQKVDGALETLMKAKPTVYEYKTARGVQEMGFLAQELQKVYPQAVSGDPTGDVTTEPMMIDYGRLTPLLTASVQELNKKVETLSAENLQLKEQLAKYENLEARLSALESVKTPISEEVSVTEKK